jgi:hypothetical protein
MVVHSGRCVQIQSKDFGFVAVMTLGLPNPGGKDPVLSKPMIAALIQRLCEKPDLYVDEMAWFI